VSGDNLRNTPALAGALQIAPRCPSRRMLSSRRLTVRSAPVFTGQRVRGLPFEQRNAQAGLISSRVIESQAIS